MNAQRASLRALAREFLLQPDPARKAAALQAVAAGELAVDPSEQLAAPPIPGRPPRPVLVPPHLVPKRRLGSPQGRAALLHAIAHIEFNAINLALDAVVRFDGMPAAFYRDWFGVAVEEARHFELLAAHLQTLGHTYGDFPAHDSLLEAARKTAGDVLARMALVPRVLEARGLDVTPGMQARLQASGDARAAGILAVILAEEVGHVAIGNRWFHWLCAARGVTPAATFRALCEAHGQGLPHPPFNVEARLAGGFSAAELDSWMPAES